VIRVPLPTFLLPGATQSYFEFDIEDIANTYSTHFTLIRFLFLAVLFLTLIQCVLVILRQY